ncbi:MAG: four-carbon acid sugar kinase family protein [Sedimentisphaerales bacterium]
MLRTKIGVIADDFTGANDTGLQFSKQGALTGVFLNLPDIDNALNEFDVVVFDTESRFDDKNTAFEKVFQAAQVFTQKGVLHIYKKLDSTMRGNIGAEIDGAIEATSARAAFVVPAMPSMGRTTIGGVCYVNGIPVGQTEAARDPKSPVLISDISAIIAEQSKRTVQYIGLEEVRSSLESLCERITSLIIKGIEIIVIDASTNDDLETIAKAVSKIDEPGVFVGSPGFAEYIGRMPELGGSNKEKSGRKHLRDNHSDAVVIAAGSVSEVTMKQVCHAMRERLVQAIDLDIEMIFNQKEDELTRVIENARTALAQGKDTIIRPAKNPEDVEKARELAAQAGLNAFECSEKIGMFLGDAINRICREFKPRGLVLTGGDIAIKVIKAMKVTGSIIKEEVLPGIASGLFLGNDFRDIVFVTKAGAFGKEDSLVKIIDYLKRK